MKLKNLVIMFFVLSIVIGPNLSIKAASVDFWSDFSEFNGIIILPVKIQDETYDFIFDTGSTLTVLDTSFEKRLGTPLNLNLPTQMPSGAMQLGYYNPIDIHLGPFNLKTKLPYLTLDMIFPGKALGHRIDGVIGMSFIHQYTWELNFDNGHLKVSDAQFSSSGVSFDATVDITPTPRGMATINVELANRQIPFIIDTGDTGTGSLTPDTIDYLVNKNQLISVASDTYVDATGIQARRRVRVKSITISDLEYRGLLMHESQYNAVGLGFLQRHRLILDFPNKKLYLQMGLKSLKVDQEDKSGLKIINDNGKLVILAVHGQSPAAAAGIDIGDIITALNDQPVTGSDLTHIRETLRGMSDKSIRLAIQRKGQTIEKRFQLKGGYDHLLKTKWIE